MGEEFNRSLRRTSGLRAGCERAANDAVLPVSAFPASLSGEDNEDAVRYSGREELECRRFSSLFIYCTIRSDCSHLGILTDYINKYRNPKELVMGWGWRGVSIVETGICLSTSSARSSSFPPSIPAVSASIRWITNCTGVEGR